MMANSLSIAGFTRQALLTAAGHRPTPAEFSHAWHAATARAEPILGDLENAYEHGLRKLTRTAAARFKKHAHPLANITASADVPQFLIPDQRLIYDEVLAMLALHSATQPLRTKIANTVLKDVGVELGLRFDLTNPLFGNALEQVGQKITQITETQRGEIMASLQKSYEAGDSIPHAAQALIEQGNVLSVSRAKMIARTEFTGTVNSASLAAAQIGTAAKYKVWLATNDDHTREWHAEADGQVVPISEPFLVDDEEMMFPGDPSGSAENVISCRCTLIYSDDPEGSQTPVADQYGPGSPGGENPNLAMISPNLPALESPSTSLPVSFANETGLNAPLSDVIQQIMALHDMPPGWLQAQVETDETRHGLVSGEYTGDSFTPGGGKIGVWGIGRHERLSFAHEFGHWLDSAGAPGWISAGREASLVYRDKAGQWVSYDTDLQGAVKDFLRACRGTNSYRFFDSYFSKPHEMWARSYSQWIAEHANNPDLLAELRDEQYKVAGAGMTKGGQWTPEEWAIIEPHVEAILRARGLIS